MEDTQPKLRDQLAKAEKWLKGVVLDHDPTGWPWGEALIYFLSREFPERDFKRGIKEVRQRWKELEIAWETGEKHFLEFPRRRAESPDDRDVYDEGTPAREDIAEQSPRPWWREGWLGIDATMMRLAEWVGGIDGAERRWRLLNGYVSRNPTELCSQAVWRALYAFSLDRSDAAAERMADALKVMVWTFYDQESSEVEPWKIWQGPRDVLSKRLLYDEEELVESVQVASALVFHGYRSNAAGLGREFLRKAERFLAARQQPGGAWQAPDPYLLKPKDSVLATAMAIHALWAAKPNGWERAVKEGANWLWTQQQAAGHWGEDPIESTFLTVLVLDAIILASGGKRVSFKMTVLPQAKGTEVTPLEDKEPVQNGRHHRRLETAEEKFRAKVLLTLEYNRRLPRKDRKTRREICKIFGISLSGRHHKNNLKAFETWQRSKTGKQYFLNYKNSADGKLFISKLNSEGLPASK
ncbi:MAG TPA: hypothetical protein DCX07_14375 [Phycisphaerales bacterium]|nr:hypothetical protein [Phycisphaerales bacterium]